MSIDIINRAKAICSEMNDQPKSFEIPRLGPDGGPLTVWLLPRKTAQFEAYLKQGTPIGQCIEVIISRSLDADLKPLFRAAQRGHIKRAFPPDLIAMWAQKITEVDEEPDWSFSEFEEEPTEGGGPSVEAMGKLSRKTSGSGASTK